MEKLNVRIRWCWALVCVLSLICCLVAAQSIGATTPPVLIPVATGLSSPTYVTNAHDGTHRLFIVEQPGRIKVLQPGSTTPTVFLDIASKVVFGGEQGLLGLAFHPNFHLNRQF